jgi:hypothetical protein
MHKIFLEQFSKLGGESMFEVLHEDDAWDVGVLHKAGLVEGSAEELGVPSELVSHFEHGQHDHRNLSEAQVTRLALRWGL